MLTVLAAAVAASPTPEAVTTEMDASGLNKRGDGTELHKRGGLVYCGNFASTSILPPLLSLSPISLVASPRTFSLSHAH